MTYTPRDPSRHLYLVPATGSVTLENAAETIRAKARDGVAITQQDSITITANEDAELVLVDAA